MLDGIGRVTTAAAQARIIRWGVTGSVVVIAGILVSGPLMVLLVEVIHPHRNGSMRRPGLRTFIGSSCCRTTAESRSSPAA